MSGEGEVAAAAVGIAAAAPVAIAAAAGAIAAATAVAAAAGVAATAAAAGVGAVGAAIGTGVGAIKMLRDFGEAAVSAGTTIKEALGDCADEFRELSVDAARRAEKAYQDLRDELEDMEESRKEEAKKNLVSTIDPASLGVEQKDIEKLSVTDLADLSSVCYHLGKIEKLIYDLEQQGADVGEVSAKAEALRDEVRQNASKHHGFGDADARAMDIVREIAKIAEDEKLDAAAVELCKREVFVIQNHIADPYLGVFENDLAEIFDREQRDEAAIELERLRVLVVSFAMKARAIETASSDSYEELQEYVKDVREQLDRDVHISEKIRYIEELIPVIDARYKDCLADNQELFELKQQYDTYFLALSSIHADLGEASPKYAFNAKDPSASIAEAKLLVEQAGDRLDKLNAQRKLHASIAAAMRRRRWSLVAQETKRVDGAEVITATYHIENGNVVQFITDAEGHLVYGVSGVKTQGMAMDRESIYQSQIKFCAQRQDVLGEISQGAEREFTSEWHDEPNRAEVFEIELREGVVPGALSRLEQAKRDHAGGGAAQGQGAGHRHQGGND